MKLLNIVLRPGFGICLFLSQFTSNRNSFFTDNFYILLLVWSKQWPVDYICLRHQFISEEQKKQAGWLQVDRINT
jgi:hypothetical protein